MTAIFNSGEKAQISDSGMNLWTEPSLHPNIHTHRQDLKKKKPPPPTGQTPSRYKTLTRKLLLPEELRKLTGQGLRLYFSRSLGSP